jgi:hypothetical protein
MYGLLIESISEFAKRVYGKDIWDIVRKKAKIDFHTFSTQQQYSETLMTKLIKTLAEVTGIYIFLNLKIIIIFAVKHFKFQLQIRINVDNSDPL